MTDPTIHVAAAVRFLEVFKPALLDALRRDNPDPSAQAALQTEGAVLGGDDVVLDAAAATAATFLATIDEAAFAAIRTTRRTLNAAQWIELAGKLLALGSAGSLIALLLARTSLAGGSREQALVLATVGFLAAAIPLIVSFMRGSITDPSGLLKSYAALKVTSIEAAQLRRELAAAQAAAPRDRDRLAMVIDRADALARTAFDILTDLGHDIRPGFASG